jgi:hypothetical protein
MNLIFTKEVKVQNKYKLAACVPHADVPFLVHFTLDLSLKQASVHDFIRFDNLSMVNGFKFKVISVLLLVESTKTSTCVGAKLNLWNYKYTLGIFQLEPVINGTVINFFTVDDSLLAYDFYFTNSGLRNGLESTNLIIGYNKNIYIWDWKSGSSNAAVTLKTDQDFRIFKTIPGTEKVFLTSTFRSITFYSPEYPKSNIFSFSSNNIYDVCISPTRSGLKKHLAIVHRSEDYPGQIMLSIFEDEVASKTTLIVDSNSNSIACHRIFILDSTQNCVCPEGTSLTSS